MLSFDSNLRTHKPWPHKLTIIVHKISDATNTASDASTVYEHLSTDAYFTDFHPESIRVIVLHYPAVNNY